MSTSAKGNFVATASKTTKMAEKELEDCVPIAEESVTALVAPEIKL